MRQPFKFWKITWFSKNTVIAMDDTASNQWELRKIFKEYDQIGMTDNEEKQNVEEQNSDLEAVIAKIKEEIGQLAAGKD